MLLRHLLVLGLPFVTSLLSSLDFAFVVTGFDIGLTESVNIISTFVQSVMAMSLDAYFSLVSRRDLSAASASSSRTCNFLLRLSFC